MHDGRGAGESLAAATEIAADIRHVFGGHVHRQMLYYQGQGRGLLELCQRPVPRFRCRRTGAGSPPSGPSGNRATGDRRPCTRCLIVMLRGSRSRALPTTMGGGSAAIRAAGLPDFAERLSRGQ